MDKSFNRGVHSVFGSVVTFNKGKSAAGSITRVGNTIYVVDVQRADSEQPRIARSSIVYASGAVAAAAMETLIRNKRIEYSG